MTSNNPIEICGEIMHDTPLAILFHDGKAVEWIPKSQVSETDPDPYEFGQIVTITIPEWLAFEKGFI